MSNPTTKVVKDLKSLRQRQQILEKSVSNLELKSAHHQSMKRQIVSQLQELNRRQHAMEIVMQDMEKHMRQIMNFVNSTATGIPVFLDGFDDFDISDYF